MKLLRPAQRLQRGQASVVRLLTIVVLATTLTLPASALPVMVDVPADVAPADLPTRERGAPAAEAFEAAARKVVGPHAWPSLEAAHAAAPSRMVGMSADDLRPTMPAPDLGPMAPVPSDERIDEPWDLAALGRAMPPMTATTREPHLPIVIRSDADFTPANGVRSGSGTEADPYVIADWDVPSVGRYVGGLHIEGTQAHAVVRNVAVVPLVADGPCSDAAGGLLALVNGGDPAAWADPQNLRDCLAHAANYWLEDAARELELWGQDAPVRSVQVVDAANLRLDGIVAPDADVMGCTDCAVEGGFFLMLRGAELERVRIAHNEFAHLHIYPIGSSTFGGRNVDIVENHRVGFAGWLYAIQVQVECPATVSGNVMEGIYSNMLVDCQDPAGSFVATDNQALGPGGLYLGGAASIVADRNLVTAGTLGVGYTASSHVCDNEVRAGRLELPQSDDVFLCANRLQDTDVVAVRTYGPPPPGTHFVARDNAVVRTSGADMRYFIIRGVEDVQLANNSFDGSAVSDSRSNVHAHHNSFTNGQLSHLCDPDHAYACRMGSLDVHDNTFEGGNGLLAFDCVSVRAYDNTFSNLSGALVADNCGDAAFDRNVVEDASAALLLNADDVHATQNTITGGELALVWIAGGDASVTGNTITDARQPVLLDSFSAGLLGTLSAVYANADFSGTLVDGKTIDVLAGCSQADVDAVLPQTHTLVLVGCSDVSVAGRTLGGIVAANTTRLTVSSNLFPEVAVAVQDFGGVDTRVEGNVVDGAALGYIAYQPTRPHVSGNTFKGIRSAGALLYFADHASIQENDFEGGAGAETVFGSHDELTDNRVRASTVGLFAGGSTSTRIARNDVRGAAVWGILVVQPGDEGTAIEDNTVLGARNGIGEGNGPVRIARNVVLGTYGTSSPASFQDDDLFYEHYFMAPEEPLGTGLWIAIQGHKDVHDNVIAGHPVGVYVDSDWSSPLTATVEDNDVGHNGAGFWHVGSGVVDLAHNDIHDNGWGYYTDCRNTGVDDCGPRMTANRVADNRFAGLYLYDPFHPLPVTGNAFEGNGIGYGYVTFSFQEEVLLPTDLCTGTANWWGDATGPASDWNIGGRGDPIVCHSGVFGGRYDQVTLGAHDWLTSPPSAGARVPKPALAASATHVAAGDTVLFSAAMPESAAWLWSYGDGAYDGWGPAASSDHAYRHGLRTYPASAIARTPDGRPSVAGIAIDVAPRTPQAGLTWSAADAVIGQPIHLAATYGDPDGPSSFAWDLGDGTNATTAFGDQPRTPFEGSLYFHGVTGSLDRQLGGLNTLDTQAPVSPAPKAWPAYANVRGYCCLKDQDPRIDLEPNWAIQGPLYSAGDLTVEFWAGTLTHPLIVDDWEIRLEVDGSPYKTLTGRGTTLGPVPTRVQVTAHDVELRVHDELRVFVDGDFDDASSLGYVVYYDGASHASRLLFGAPPQVDTAAPSQAPAVAPSGNPVPMVLETVADAHGLADSLRSLGASDVTPYTLAPYVFAHVPAAALDAASRLPGVVAAYKDEPVIPFGTGDVLTVTRVDEARAQLGLTGKGVTIAIIDGGFDTHHADLKGRVRVVDLRDGSEVGDDGALHGTAMAGVAAGAAGVAPDANVLGIVVGFQDTLTPMHEFMDAFEWVANHAQEEGIRVVSLSAGQYCSPSCDGTRPLSRMADALALAGVLPVIAAGNGGPGAGTIASPGDAEYALTVGALDWKGTVDRADDEVAGFSSRGGATSWNKPDLVAPGTNVPAPTLGGGRFAISGTSPATAHVAGLAALLLEARPDLTPLELKALLTTTARDAGPAGVDPTYGWGVADVAEAAVALSGLHTLAPDHTYARPGVYTANLTLRDAFGVATFAAVEIPVAKAAGDPVARMEAASQAGVGQSRAFADTSRDTHGGITARSWDFGDGATSSAAMPTHAWTAPGTYDVVLTVTNAIGHTDAATAAIVVSEAPSRAVWFAHGIPYSNQLAPTSPQRDIHMDASPPGSPVPKAWSVLRNQQTPPATTTPVQAAAWELRGPAVHVNGTATLVVWAGTKQGNPLWVDSFLVALYADGVRVASAEGNGSTLGPVPTELRLAMSGIDVRAASVLAVAVSPKFHTASGLQNLSDLEDPVTFWFDNDLTPTRLEADLDRV